MPEYRGNGVHNLVICCDMNLCSKITKSSLLSAKQALN